MYKLLLLILLTMNTINAKSTEEYIEEEKLLTQTCNDGNTNDCIKLAMINYFGLNGVKDINRTIELFEKIITLGDMRGYANLSTLYYQGAGVKQDKAKAIRYLEKGCDGNGAYSCFYLERIQSNRDDPLASNIKNTPLLKKSLKLLDLDCKKK